MPSENSKIYCSNKMNNPILENYTHYRDTGKNSVFRIDIHIIGGCNFRCVMCDNHKQKVELHFGFEDLQRYIFILKKHYHCSYIRFHGQEPTLHSRLEDLVHFSKKLGLKTAVKTNGWLLNNARLVKLLVAGLDELYLSIDGPNAEIHDTIRGMPNSFAKNTNLMIRGKRINPHLKIYVNSVVMKSNFQHLHEMLDFGKKHQVDRMSFVFLNDKNRKDIDGINLSKADFFMFFEKHLVEIYKKSSIYGIPVDFSPFLSDLCGRDNDYIRGELQNNFAKYATEIGAFYAGEYGKYFYDRYGCFSPIDHASINYNGDMYGCCVVERDSTHSVGNIIQDDLIGLWESDTYRDYRQNSNESCAYGKKCASNFSTRKKLFRDIYLHDDLYDKNNPLRYYRYLQEFQGESDDVKNEIRLLKLKKILLHFYDNLPFYRDLLSERWVNRRSIENANGLDFIRNLPILDKNILRGHFDEIKRLSLWKNSLSAKTAGTSGNRLDFFYPLDFKRYIRQIAIFSQEFGLVYDDFYFSLTPANCNQTIIQDLQEPDYVKKIYIPTTNVFDFNEAYFLEVQDVFLKHTDVRYLHTDAKHLLYIILWFSRYGLDLPLLSGISLTYSYTNRSMRRFIEHSFACKVCDNYGCSETWPISIENSEEKVVFGDAIILENIDGKIIVTDLDNDVFCFIRYQNGDVWESDGERLDIFGKDAQVLCGKHLREIDIFLSSHFPQIVTYQFVGDTFFYFGLSDIDTEKIGGELSHFLQKKLSVRSIREGFFTMGECSKFRYIT